MDDQRQHVSVTDQGKTVYGNYWEKWINMSRLGNQLIWVTYCSAHLSFMDHCASYT